MVVQRRRLCDGARWCPNSKILSTTVERRQQFNGLLTRTIWHGTMGLRVIAFKICIWKLETQIPCSKALRSHPSASILNLGPNLGGCFYSLLFILEALSTLGRSALGQCRSRQQQSTGCTFWACKRTKDCRTGGSSPVTSVHEEKWIDQIIQSSLLYGRKLLRSASSSFDQREHMMPCRLTLMNFLQKMFWSEDLQNSRSIICTTHISLGYQVDDYGK